MNIEYNDGGRVKAGLKGGVADCVTRAIAIALDQPYLSVRASLRAFNPDGGINTLDDAFRAAMRSFGLVWVSVAPGTQLTDLPKGRLIVWVPGHYTAIIDGTIQDTDNPNGMAVLGYWAYNADRLYNVYEGKTRVNRYPLAGDVAVNMARLLNLNYKRKTFIA